MTLREALINQGNDIETVDDIIQQMAQDIIDDTDPEAVLDDYGLEPDYVFDLLDLIEEC